MDFNQAVWFLDIDRCYSPSPTPSTTSTVTPSPTPSMTPSPTPSNTPTPTPSATVYAIQLNGPANSASEACNWTGAPPLLTIYVRTFFEQYQIITCNTTSGNIAVYTTPQLTTPFNGQGSWYSTKNSSQPLSNCSFIINSSGIASNFTTCPAPSPSVTVSPTPSPTPSVTPTPSNTPSITPTPTPTPSDNLHTSVEFRFSVAPESLTDPNTTCDESGGSLNVLTTEYNAFFADGDTSHITRVYTISGTPYDGANGYFRISNVGQPNPMKAFKIDATGFTSAHNTATNCVSPSPTPSNSPTPSITPSNTPTPTPTPSTSPNYAQIVVRGGVNTALALCSASETFNLTITEADYAAYTATTIPANREPSNITKFYDSVFSAPYNGQNKYFYVEGDNPNDQKKAFTIATDGTLQNFSSPVCAPPEPSSSPSPTPSITPSNTPTPTPTPSTSPNYAQIVVRGGVNTALALCSASETFNLTITEADYAAYTATTIPANREPSNITKFYDSVFSAPYNGQNKYFYVEGDNPNDQKKAFTIATDGTLQNFSSPVCAPPEPSSSPSPTPSITPSNTPTPTPTPSTSPNYAQIVVRGGVNTALALCSASETFNLTITEADYAAYTATTIPANREPSNITKFYDSVFSAPYNGQNKYFYVEGDNPNDQKKAFTIATDGTLQNFSSPVCAPPEPSSSPSPTPSITPSPTPTPSTSELANCDFNMLLTPDFSNQITIYADTNGSNCTSFNVETTYNNIYVSNSAKVNDLPSGTIVYTDVNLTTHIIGGGPTIFTSSLNPTRFTFQIDTNGVIYNRISCP